MIDSFFSLKFYLRKNRVRLIYEGQKLSQIIKFLVLYLKHKLFSIRNSVAVRQTRNIAERLPIGVAAKQVHGQRTDMRNEIVEIYFRMRVNVTELNEEKQLV